MFRLLFTGLFIMLFYCNGSAQPPPLRALLMYAQFFSPEKGPYIETYISVNAATVVLKPISGSRFQGAVEITMIFKQNDSIKYFDKYNLQGPVADTAVVNGFFIDQHRMALRNGVYDFLLSMKDVSGSAEPFSHHEAIIVDFNAEKIAFSNIQLIESYDKAKEKSQYSKGGYDLIPYVSTFYPENTGKILFYSEIYNTKKALGTEGQYLLSYFIELYETKKTLNQYMRQVRKNTSDVDAMLGEFSIKDLPTGNYNLVVEARDRNNVILGKQKIFFQRVNTTGVLSLEDLGDIDVNQTFVSNIINRDTLKEHLRCLRPISGRNEVSFAEGLVASGKIEMMQKYFYHFWKKRDSSNPESAWYSYYEEVKIANQRYSARIRKGYDTDRGRIFLSYGHPNQIAKSEKEPSSYPYEIWHYYQTNGQSNVKFVFLDEDLSSRDYELIHSTALGEINDRKWHLRTVRRNTAIDGLDMEKGNEHYGSRALELFNNPR